MSPTTPTGARARLRELQREPRELMLRSHERRREPGGHPHVRSHRLAVAVVAMVVGMLAIMPTASAFASASPSVPVGGAGTAKRSSVTIGRLTVPGELLSAGQLQSLLAALPLSDLSAKQLARYLAHLEGIEALGQLKLGLLTDKQLELAGLEESLREAVEQLGPSAKLGELANVHDVLPAFETALEGRVNGLLKTLLGTLPPGTTTELEKAFGSLSLEQLVASLLSAASPKEQLATELSKLAGDVFDELGSEGGLGELLGRSKLGGFTPRSVEEVAEELKTAPGRVSEELGQSTATLPETTTMLTAPLEGGKLAGVAPAVSQVAPDAKKLVTGVLGALTAGTGSKEEGGGDGSGGEGKGGSSESKGSGAGEGGNGAGEGKGSGDGGGQGGPGGAGTGGSNGSTTVVLTLPPNSSASSAAKAAKGSTGKIAIISHRVRGRVATIVLRVPSAGTAAISGREVKGASKQAARAERLAMRVELSRAVAASLRHHRRRLAVTLHASFTRVGGSRSQATVTVVFV